MGSAGFVATRTDVEWHGQVVIAIVNDLMRDEGAKPEVSDEPDRCWTERLLEEVA